MAVTTVLRGLRAGDGAPLALCWKELWDLHEAWGGYTTDREARAFDKVAERLERDAEERGREVNFGRHIHLVAEHEGRVVGQVEGWIDRLGVHKNTRTVCEIRSLVVRKDVRRAGIARKLLDRLAVESERISGESCIAIAEVLEANPAIAFYERLGFKKVAWTRRATPKALDHTELLTSQVARPVTVRRSRAGDENAVARLETRFAERRKRLGDARYDPPQTLDAAWLGVLRGLLSTNDPLSPQPFVATTIDNEVLATSQYWTQELDPPFSPQARAIASRIESFDHEEAYEGMKLLARGLLRLAKRANVAAIEFIDLPPPTYPLSKALDDIGIKPWSCIVQRG